MAPEVLVGVHATVGNSPTAVSRKRSILSLNGWIGPVKLLPAVLAATTFGICEREFRALACSPTRELDEPADKHRCPYWCRAVCRGIGGVVGRESRQFAISFRL